jgi:hypothetical protein
LGFDGVGLTKKKEKNPEEIKQLDALQANSDKMTRTQHFSHDAIIR